MILRFTPTAIEDSEELPCDFLLSQNYPNPFNATTRISFSIAEATTCTVTIYDIMGRETARLLEGLEQAGKHSISWDVGACPSGVYFARLTAGNQVRSIKMILAK